ncbi:hypothetical protein, partial [Ilyomonas limi]|uniref:hypothetical protein n=1 Tax=Ilyomonas limi TaxID=2575867 RepID=UPI001F10D229
AAALLPKTGGQFIAKSPGQFAPKCSGQLVAKWSGQYQRNLQYRKRSYILEDVHAIAESAG